MLDAKNWIDAALGTIFIVLKIRRIERTLQVRKTRSRDRSHDIIVFGIAHKGEQSWAQSLLDLRR